MSGSIFPFLSGVMFGGLPVLCIASTTSRLCANNFLLFTCEVSGLEYTAPSNCDIAYLQKVILGKEKPLLKNLDELRKSASCLEERARTVEEVSHAIETQKTAASKEYIKKHTNWVPQEDQRAAHLKWLPVT